MTFTIESEQTMLLELLEIVEKALDIEFSASECKILLEYIKNYPNADPKNILEEIITLAEKKLNKKITEDKKREIDSRCRITQIIDRIAQRSLLKKRITQSATAKTNVRKIIGQKIKRTLISGPINKMPSPKNAAPIKLIDPEIKRIIDKTEKKLLDKRILKRPLDKNAREKAENLLKKSIRETDANVDIANRAILGVIKVGIAGGVRIVVLQNLGNPLIPDMNPLHGDSFIDQANKTDLSRNDPMGAKCHAILNIINSGNIDPMFVAKLDEGIVHAEQLGAGCNSSTVKQTAPIPTPYVKD